MAFSVTVTRNTTTNAYSWSYGSSNTAIACTTNVATVAKNSTQTISVTISSGTAGDTVVWNATQPLQFTNGNGGGNIANPSWYSVAGGGTATITITDNNSAPPVATDTYYFVLQATYTPQGGTAGPQVSPDPTIINTGTGGQRCWVLPGQHQQLPEIEVPAAEHLQSV